MLLYMKKFRSLRNFSRIHCSKNVTLFLMYSRCKDTLFFRNFQDIN